MFKKSSLHDNMVTRLALRNQGGVPPYMEFTLGSAHAQNFIKFCRKIVYYMCVLFVRYLLFHLLQLLNLKKKKIKIKRMDTLIKSGPRRQDF